MTVQDALLEILPPDEANEVLCDLEDQFAVDGYAVAVTSNGLVLVQRNPDPAGPRFKTQHWGGPKIR